MLGTRKLDPELDTGKVLDSIEKAAYLAVKSYGFKRHGRTLHRFVSGDISQVINFQLGQSYLGETHLLFVNVGIRVPECMTRSFRPEEKTKTYYRENECNIRSFLGTVEGKERSCYDLRQSCDMIIADILRQIQTCVIPAFEALNSRDAILARRRQYPQFDLLNNHLILLEESMIYGRRGEAEKAAETLNLYYHLFSSGKLAQKDRRAIESHMRYINGLAAELGINITQTNSDKRR